MPRMPAVSPLHPWHMWGSAQTITINAAAGSGAGSYLFPKATQLYRINYKRPETWSFWFSAQLVGGNISDVNMQVIAEFNLMLGVGRTAFKTEGLFGTDAGFCEFRWSVIAGVQPGNPPRKKWTTRFNTPALDEVTGSTTQEKIDWLPAQDLQCEARAALVLTGATAVNNQVILEVVAWAAPRTHVRPDWFEGQYSGAELAGT